MAVYLCGFMGCGKSTVSVILAKKMGHKCCDTDELIVKKEGLTIPEIFEKHGEEYFRRAETELLEELSSFKGVVSCGGGMMLFKKNADIANKNGGVVFIDTSFETCYKRISGDGNRPIASGKSREELKALFDERYDKYKRNSIFSVDGESSPMQIANDIYRLMMSW